MWKLYFEHKFSILFWRPLVFLRLRLFFDKFAEAVQENLARQHIPMSVEQRTALSTVPFTTVLNVLRNNKGEEEDFELL